MKKAATLIEFFYKEEILYTFVVRGNDNSLNIYDLEPIVIANKMSSSLLQEALDELTQHFDYEQINGKNLAELHSSLEGLSLERFYETGRLIFSTELLDLIAETELLYIVPYGILHYFPLHACKLPSQEFLIDHFVVSYLPSASILAHFRKNSISNISSVLLAGIDSTGYDHIFLKEMEQIGALACWEKAEVKRLFRQECSRANILAHLSNMQLIHLSAHGHFNAADPMASGVSLFGQYSNNYVDGEGLAEEDYQWLLSAYDIYQTEKIEAELLVLSACISANNERKEGEELIGLSRSIFAAGVQSSILCLFPTVKQVTAHPTVPELRFARFYELWLEEGYSKAKAFQQFILGIKKHRDYAHPFFWCPFVFMGKID